MTSSKFVTSIYIAALLSLLIIPSFAQTKTTSFKPGQTFKDCKNCPEMVVIPAGSFLIGSPESETGRSSNPDEGPTEGPQRLVHIQQFAGGKFDITKEQWAVFVKATNHPAGGYCGWAWLPE